MQIPAAASLPAFAASKSSPASRPLFAGPAEPDTGARAEFRKRAQMSPGEQMRASVLDSLHLTESDVAAMNVADRAKVEAKIKAMIETRVEQAAAKKGLLVDLKA